MYNVQTYIRCPKKTLVTLILQHSKMVKSNDIILQKFLLSSICLDLCTILNPCIVFYLSYEHQKMAASNLASHRCTMRITSCTFVHICPTMRRISSDWLISICSMTVTAWPWHCVSSLTPLILWNCLFTSPHIKRKNSDDMME